MKTCKNCYFQSPVGNYCPLCGQTHNTPSPKEEGFTKEDFLEDCR